jgi:hypothetical protein
MKAAGGGVKRKVPVQKLRGLEPTLLEVQLQVFIEQPFRRVAVVNVGDLLELSRLDDAPANILRLVRGYREQVARDVADLPNGPGFDSFIEDMTEAPSTRVPLAFREILAAEREARGEVEVAAIDTLLASWEGSEPEPFVITEPPKSSPVVKKVAEAPRAASKKAVKADGEPAPRRRRTAKPPVKRVDVPDLDPEQVAWVSQVILERLASTTSESGLGQTVLVAGVRHRARQLYPRLGPQPVMAALKGLEEKGRVRHSAGRWRYVGRR